MDYKEKYEEAMQLAKEWYEDKSTNQKEKVLLESMYPQLKESDDERIRKKIIELVKKHSVNTERCQMEDWLEKQSESKWSEEDEEMVNETIYFINEFQKSNKCKDEEDMQNSVTCENWLKSLKPQSYCEYNPYKVTIKSILEMCARYDNTLTCDKQDFLDNVRVKCKDAIEYDNLHSQDYWKPTQEQMDLLYWVKENRVFDYADREILRSLYNDLKKL